MSSTTIPLLPRTGNLPAHLSVRVRLLLLVLATVLALVLLQAYLNLRSVQDQTEKQALNQLHTAADGFEYAIKAHQETVLSAASILASRSDLIDLAQAQDREGLISLLGPIYRSLSEQHRLTHLYVHDPEGKVIVRLHNPVQFGDNVTYRRTAADAIAERKSTAGVELGPNFLGVRGVAPLIRNGALIGLVEVGLDLDKTEVARIKEQYSSDYTLWLSSDLAATASYTLKGTEKPAPIKGILYYDSTAAGDLNIPASDYEAVVNRGETRLFILDRNNETYAIVLQPLLGYGNRTFGVLEARLSIQSSIDMMRRDQLTIVLIAAALIIASLSLFFYGVNRLVLLPLKALTRAAEKQYAGDMSARVEPLGRNEFGSLAETFNSLSTKVGQLLDQQKASIVEKERMIRQLKEMSRYKDEFLAVMSHELRTPLNAMIGLLGIVNMSGKIDPQNTTLIQRARANSNRLLNLINNILDISRMEAGRQQIVPSDMSLRRIVAKIKQDMSILGDQKQLDFRVSIDESVPETIFMDEDAINKMLINLIGNAVKFTKQGYVAFKATCQGDNLVMKIIDTGIGIPQHMHDVIFESFRQVDSTSTRNYGGTGLGLAIVRNLCNAMGGRVQIESQPGEGSTFTVTLPLPNNPAHAPALKEALHAV